MQFSRVNHLFSSLKILTHTYVSNADEKLEINFRFFWRFASLKNDFLKPSYSLNSFTDPTVCGSGKVSSVIPSNSFLPSLDSYTTLHLCFLCVLLNICIFCVFWAISSTQSFSSLICYLTLSTLLLIPSTEFSFQCNIFHVYVFKILKSFILFWL